MNRRFNILRTAVSRAISGFGNKLFPYVNDLIVDLGGLGNKIGIPSDWIFPTLKKLRDGMDITSGYVQSGFGSNNITIPSVEVTVKKPSHNIKSAIGTEYRNKMEGEKFVKVMRNKEQKKAIRHTKEKYGLTELL
jgi:hypothetical protein